MNVKLLSLGLEMTPHIKQANEKIEQFFKKYYKSSEKVTQYNNEKTFITQLSKSVKDVDVVVVTTENQLYLPFKSFVAKAFNLEKKKNKKIISEIRASKSPIRNDLAKLKSQSTIPSGSIPLISEDGLYSGFVVKSNLKIVVVLPQDEKRIDYILNESFVEYLEEHFPKVIENAKDVNEDPTYDEILIKSCVDKLENNSSKVAIALTKTVDFFNVINKEVQDLTPVIIQSDYSEDKGERPLREFAISLAKGAKVSNEADLGVAITNVFSIDKEDGTQEMFLYICVADDTQANALKLYSKKGETVPHFVLSAINEIFVILNTWTNEGSIFPVIKDKTNANISKKGTKVQDNRYMFVTKLVVSLLIVFSFILSVVTAICFDDVYNLRATLAKKENMSISSISTQIE